jgi:hypothetical protein
MYTHLYSHRLLINQGPGSGLNLVKGVRDVSALPGHTSTALRTTLLLPTAAVPALLKNTVAIKPAVLKNFVAIKPAVRTKLVRMYPACLHLASAYKYRKIFYLYLVIRLSGYWPCSGQTVLVVNYRDNDCHASEYYADKIRRGRQRGDGHHGGR